MSKVNKSPNGYPPKYMRVDDIQALCKSLKEFVEHEGDVCKEEVANRYGVPLTIKVDVGKRALHDISINLQNLWHLYEMGSNSGYTGDEPTPFDVIQAMTKAGGTDCSEDYFANGQVQQILGINEQ